MATFGFENFRSQVVWCATDSSLSLARIENLCGKAEVTNLQTHTVSQK